ncbi:hypothetical protein DERP_002869 [Dermatophagoides pteronyssinus]|uniref:Uncharacterized protein n=1 Tax=Dermatophagoides pteronyssinus TaxID=6956 RepID=A0ABQ8JVW5_DERPT|nr:hypothetical protein DERP_002869 [Dermatophagoides pteronyssinus]
MSTLYTVNVAVDDYDALDSTILQSENCNRSFYVRQIDISIGWLYCINMGNLDMDDIIEKDVRRKRDSHLVNI